MKKFKSWSYLQTVLAVSEHGSFRAAGEDLGISSSTVTRHIDVISEEIGEPIFVPKGQRWALTQAGQELVNIADETHARLGFMFKNLANKDGFYGTLHIHTLSFIGSDFLAPKTHLWCDENPFADLHIDASDHTTSIEKGEADVALRLMRPDDDGIARFKLANCPVSIFHPQKGNKEGWVGLPRELDHIPEMRLALGHFQKKPTLRLESFRAIAEAAVATGQACILPTCIARNYAALKLTETKNKELTVNRELWFLFYEKRKNDRAINAARDWVKKIFPSPNRCLCGECS